MPLFRLGISGMRGETPHALTPLLAIDYASAMATYLDSPTIVVAYDNRASSKMLFEAVKSGLLSCGSNVINAGCCTQAELRNAVTYNNCMGGIYVGAGHHPYGWNALVAINRLGANFNRTQTQELLDIYHSKRFAVKPWNELGSYRDVDPVFRQDYIKKLTKIVDVEAIRQAKFKVAMDFCNGPGKLIAAPLASILGFELLSINDSINYNLPHDPEPRPSSAFQTASILKLCQADIGFVFNTNCDRASVVCEDGDQISEEYTFPLATLSSFFQKKTSAIVVTNTCTTLTLDELVKSAGGEVIKSNVAEADLIDAMIEHNAILSGTGSGSVAHRDGVAGFDAILSTLLILEAMAKFSQPISQVRKHLKSTYIVKRKVKCNSAHAYSRLKELKNNLECDSIDDRYGLRFNWKDGWLSIRMATTEPIIRMVLEWNDKEEAKEKMIYYRGLVERWVTI